jgi:hypothetical protein
MFDHKSIIPPVPVEISGLSEKTGLGLEEKLDGKKKIFTHLV